MSFARFDLFVLGLTEGDWLSITFTITAKFFIGIALNTVWLYTAELYPTSLRNTGVGVSSSFARIGATVAPLLAILVGVILNKVLAVAHLCKKHLRTV